MVELLRMNADPTALKNWLLAALLLLALGCSRQSTESRKEPETYVPAAGSVAFDIRPSSGDTQGHVTSWEASHSSSGKTARFRIDLGARQGSGKHGIYYGTGKLGRVSNSDGTLFLKELMQALEATKFPRRLEKQETVSFEWAELGKNQTRFADDSFSDSPPGNWLVLKVFLANGEGEVFLNLNPEIGKGEFSIKDADYGNMVLSELAKVL